MCECEKRQGWRWNCPRKTSSWTLAYIIPFVMTFEGTYVLRLFSNLAIDRWRRMAGATVCSLDADAVGKTSAGPRRARSGSANRDSGGAPLLSCIADDRPSAMPELSFLRAETGRRVRTALSALPGDYRRAVVLADVQGYSYEEIAKHVGCPVGTIRSRLHRGRQLLRQNLLRLESQEEGVEACNTNCSFTPAERPMGRYAVDNRNKK